MRGRGIARGVMAVVRRRKVGNWVPGGVATQVLLVTRKCCVVLRFVRLDDIEFAMWYILFRFSMAVLFQGDFESIGPLRLCHSKSMGLSVPLNAMLRTRIAIKSKIDVRY